MQVDIGQEKQIESLTKQVRSDFGKIDILVNNAGLNIRKMPQDYQAAEWDEVLNINLRGAFLFAKAVYPAMKEAGGGKIINIGSMTSILGGAKLAPYGASKGGIVQLTQSLAVAWAVDNIQVNAILPGFINSELTIQARKDIPELNEKVLTRTPISRWGEPEDLAGTAIYMASGASDFVTGVAVPVDGGFSVML
jgi:2-deoxy-D-gluconate 3-dehydrogenase